MEGSEGKGTVRSNLSRRDLFKAGGIVAVGAMGVSALAACAPKESSSASSGTEAAAAAPAGYQCSGDWLGAAPAVGTPEETHDCDILVAGGGHAGIQAALAAAEGGAKVIVIETVSEGNRKVKGEDIGHVNSQWLIDQGFGPYDVGEVTAEFVKRTGGRASAEILRKYVANSGEMFDHTASMVQWPDDRIKVTSTADPTISPLDPSQVIVQVPGIAADGPVSYPLVRGGIKAGLPSPSSWVRFSMNLRKASQRSAAWTNSSSLPFWKELTRVSNGITRRQPSSCFRMTRVQ